MAGQKGRHMPHQRAGTVALVPGMLVSLDLYWAGANVNPGTLAYARYDGPETDSDVGTWYHKFSFVDSAGRIAPIIVHSIEGATPLRWRKSKEVVTIFASDTLLAGQSTWVNSVELCPDPESQRTVLRYSAPGQVHPIRPRGRRNIPNTRPRR